MNHVIKIKGHFKIHYQGKSQNEASLTLTNIGEIPLTSWQLHFSFNRIMIPESLQNGTQIKQSGDYHIVAPTANGNLLPGGSHTFVFQYGPSPLFRYCDGPGDLFLTIPSEGKMRNVVSIDSLDSEFGFDAEEHKQLEQAAQKEQGHRPLPKTSTILDNIDSPSTISIIPAPNELTELEGDFLLNENVTIAYEANHSGAKESALYLQRLLVPYLDFDMKLVEHSSDENPSPPFPAIRFVLASSEAELGEEGYQLNVVTSGITISANEGAGFFYGIMTLRQLLLPEFFGNQSVKKSSWYVPCAMIVDRPRFAYRGFHLDVSRHFHSVDDVKRLLDLMANLKFNRFHWHLTDDEGWRVEIKAFPELTQIGAWRGINEVLQPQFASGAGRYGGYYTQDEIKEVLAYAQERHIQVIPEIDIPGHSRAAIKSLPHLLQETEDQSIYNSVQHYNDNALNPGLTGTYEVLFTVFDEIAELFPCSIVHVGADELAEGVWEKSPACEKLKAQEGLKDTKELQGYFLRKIQDHLAKRGKVTGGWEEIIHGNKVSQEAIVYSWTGVEAGIQAAEAGFPVVMMPAQHTYLDLTYSDDPAELGQYWAGSVDLKKVYDYEPFHSSLSETGKKNILGVEGALWTELIDSQEKLDHMIFPRIAGLAEVAWSPVADRNWNNFLNRLPMFLERLEKYGVAYRDPRKN